MHSSKNLQQAILDPYAEIALFDAAENQRVALEAQKAEAKKKGAPRLTRGGSRNSTDL